MAKVLAMVERIKVPHVLSEGPRDGEPRILLG